MSIAAIAAIAAFALTGCSTDELSRGFLPRGASTGAQRVQDLWVGGWIAALVVGVLVWGLVIWCVVAYRRKKDDTGLPPQLRYNVPIELLYTVVPLMMVGVLFYFTARDEAVLLDTSAKPDVTVNVIAKQWSWDFNYVEAEVYESGVQATLTGKPGVEETLPTMYLPVNQRVEFVLTARDVIHSFWVPAFQQKMDLIPGKVNKFQVTPDVEGTYQGKCAELCGQYHATMLFNVKVVSEQDYQAHLQTLRDKGQVGRLDNSLSRAGLQPADEKLLPQQWQPEGKN